VRPPGSRTRVVVVSLLAVIVATLLSPKPPVAGAPAFQGAAPVTDPECEPTYSTLPLVQSVREDWWGEGLPQHMRLYRVRHDVTAARNVAVFQYCDEKGRLLYVTVASASSDRKKVVYDVRDKSLNLVRTFRVGRTAANKHAEQALIKWLPARGIPLASVRNGFTERKPCLTRGHFCEVNLARVLPHVPIGYSREHGPDASPESIERAKRDQEADDKELKAQWSASKSLFRAAPQGSATGALLETVNLPASPSSGGIDFSSLELRYLADRGSADQEGLRYAFRVRPTVDGQASVGGLPYAQQASDAFFVWLALPPSSFTVNLNPNEPNRIIDAKFGRTDAGRALLEADLQLKKTTAALIHPNTELGHGRE